MHVTLQKCSYASIHGTCIMLILLLEQFPIRLLSRKSQVHSMPPTNVELHEPEPMRQRDGMGFCFERWII